MGCLAGILGILIFLIVLIAVVKIAQIVLSYAGAPPIVVQIANIVFWAVIAIACVYVLGHLLFCALPVGRW